MQWQVLLLDIRATSIILVDALVLLRKLHAR